MSDAMTADRRPLDEVLAFALDVVAEAGTLTERHFRNPDLAVETKSDGSPVTVADRGAEKLIRDAIGDEFPDDTIVGEEFGGSLDGTGRQWIIDPIDGTASFTAGVPLYSNLLAVVDDGVPVLGVINLPALSETVWATAGGGAFCNGEPCRVNTTAQLDGAYAMTSGVRYWPHGGLDRLADLGMKVRTWGDAYGYALVATGRVEAMIDPIVSVWDVAPIGVILAEAGGRYTDLTGEPRIDSGHGVGTNGAIHDLLLAHLPSEGRP